MNVKIIKNTEDYEAAMARLSALMSADPAPASEQENELELLALVIEDFERKTVPPAQADPIEAILFCMDQMQLTRKEMQPYMGSVSKVSEVLGRKRPLSLTMIRKLNQGLGIPAEILIGEAGAERGQKTIARKPAKTLRRSRAAIGVRATGTSKSHEVHGVDASAGK